MKKNLAILGLIVIVVATSGLFGTSYGQQKLVSLTRRIETVINEYKPKEPVAAPEEAVDADHIVKTTGQQVSSSGVMESAKNLIIKPTAALPPPPSSYKAGSIQAEFQTWNNCGPATTVMMLRLLGEPAVQAEIAPYMKPNPDDKNVSPTDITNYLINQRGLNAIYKINGDDEMLKQLVSRGYSVIVEQWFEPHPNDGMGHYRLVTGYDDATQLYTTMDSYIGPNKTFSYKEFNDNWKVFNNTFITVYKPEQEAEIKQILGSNWDEKTMNENAQNRAVADINANDKDVFAWFNLGDAYSRQGLHKEAVTAFDKAREIGLPWRMLWYQFTIFESYLAEGRYDDVIQLTNGNLKNTATLEESFYYRGKAYEAQGKRDEARSDYEQAVNLNKNYTPAIEALKAL